MGLLCYKIPVVRKLLVLLVLFVVVAAPVSASAAELRSDRLTRAVVIASGVQAPDVSCETDDAAWDAEARSVGSSGELLNGYTYPLQKRARLAPWVCRSLTPSSPQFGGALKVVAHEAAHLAGVSNDAMSGCWGLLWAADLARQVWGIPFFTAASDRVIAQAVSQHQRSEARYRTICG